MNYLAYILTFFLAFYLAFPLGSGVWLSPAVPTEIWSSRLSARSLSPAVPTAIWTSKSFAKSMGLPPQPWHLWLPASAWRLPNLEVSCHTVPHDQQLASRPCNTCPSASASCCPEMVLAALANTFWHPALLVGGAKIGGPVGPQSDRQAFNMCAKAALWF